LEAGTEQPLKFLGSHQEAAIAGETNDGAIWADKLRRDRGIACAVQRVEHGKVAFARDAESKVDSMNLQRINEYLPAGARLGVGFIR
jgi:hypothetical protein